MPICSSGALKTFAEMGGNLPTKDLVAGAKKTAAIPEDKGALLAKHFPTVGDLAKASPADVIAKARLGPVAAENWVNTAKAIAGETPTGASGMRGAQKTTDAIQAARETVSSAPARAKTATDSYEEARKASSTGRGTRGAVESAENAIRQTDDGTTATASVLERLASMKAGLRDGASQDDVVNQVRAVLNAGEAKALDEIEKGAEAARNKIIQHDDAVAREAATVVKQQSKADRLTKANQLLADGDNLPAETLGKLGTQAEKATPTTGPRHRSELDTDRDRPEQETKRIRPIDGEREERQDDMGELREGTDAPGGGREVHDARERRDIKRSGSNQQVRGIRRTKKDDGQDIEGHR